LVWLSDTRLVFPAIIITDVWQWTPFVFLILLAGLSAINAELYEAAAIDGASAWQKFVSVTLPLLRPILLLAVLFRLIDAIKIFDIVYALTQGGPGTETLTASYFVYQAGQQFFRYSYAAAASYVLLFFVTIIALVLIRRIRET
jgi:multiple sugar transport system permease protein